ncbi:sensor histidine kinase [Desertivirga arenae]|uniref:sensor histidine kinase n=1 Tax=Desertivirga arenae TaxID=2810309 RepID=UPI001A958C2A|nr:histidine kinase [Pedobacter sp. SYSU D00823]
MQTLQAKRSEIKLHSFFWAGLCLIFIVYYAWILSQLRKDPRDLYIAIYASFSSIMWIIIPGSLVFYFNYCYLFRIKGRNRLIIIAVVTIVLITLFTRPMFSPLPSFWPSFLISIFPIIAVIWIPFTILSAVIFLIQRSREQKEVNEQILKQNAEAELALLKAQLNPHFLFNTLNNIDTLIQVDEKEKASESLIRISEMMRYTTYESANNRVPLSEEIEYLKNYIDLEMLRFSNKQLLKFEVYGEVGEIKIAPMLLIPFVENAFKHTSDKRSAYAIRIRLNISFNKLVFTCLNKCDENSRISKDKSSGVGLQNIERRLNLLYPERNDLQIHLEDGIFETKLTLDLDEN